MTNITRRASAIAIAFAVGVPAICKKMHSLLRLFLSYSVILERW
ncbi:MAG: hypothetical protein ACJA0C_001383 [Candidatus Endobugula sp.]|jgi:hypothetical protein